MKQSTILSAATLFALAAGVAAGETAKAPAAAPAATVATTTTPLTADAGFSAFDKDGDASLLQTEFPATHDLGTDLFAAFDTNKDQRLSSDEYAVYAGTRTDDASDEEEEEEAE